MRRAELGVDGNAGFALLGEDLQSGEAEFETIKTDAAKYSSEWEQAAKRAINLAFQRLKARIDEPISYYLGTSHPDFC